MNLLYSLRGDLQAVESQHQPDSQVLNKAGYFQLDDVEVTPQYIEELKKNVTNPTIAPELLLVIRLFLTFLLSEDGQKFFKNVLNWFYKLFLKQATKRFVKKNATQLYALTWTPVDKLVDQVYDETVKVLTYDLNATQKNILVKTFNGEL